MSCRKNGKGESLLSQFKEPVQRENGWWYFESVDCDESQLPATSKGPHPPDWKGTTEYVGACHGCKMEGLYAIASDWTQPGRGIKSSGDKDAGQRYNSQNGKDKRGVYLMEYPENMKGCLTYTRYAPVFGDGTHMACFIEVTVSYTHLTLPTKRIV